MTAPIRRPRTAPGGGSARAGGPRGATPGAGNPGASTPGASAPRGGASRSGGSGGGRGRRADPVRRLAYDVLIAVEQRDAYANLLLPSLLAERGLTGRDAALATELTYGTLRGRGSYDAILALCSDRGLNRVDPPLREVLRLGTHQLLATRVRPHAAVATSVDLARDLAGQRSAGFVNAVLRRVATRDLETWIGVAAPHRDTDPLGHLAVRYSHPRWMAQVLAGALGEDTGGALAETEAALAADGTRPRVTLCVVPGLADPGELVAAGGEPATWSPFGAYLAGGDPGAIEAVRTRRAAVQDEASQLAAIAVARAELSGPAELAGRDSRWLDMCAGPGGKARLLAGLAAQRGAHVLAADARPHPARRPPPRSTRPRQPGVRARSTGCWPTSRARGSGPCAAARRPAGAGRRRTSRAWAGCSAACSAAHWTQSGREAWSATSPAPRTGPRRGTSWRTCFADGTTSRCSTRPPCWLRCRTCAARSLTAGTRSSGRTGTGRTRSSWLCCAAAPTPARRASWPGQLAPGQLAPGQLAPGQLAPGQLAPGQL